MAYELTLTDSKEIARDTWEFCFRRPDDLSWDPGQSMRLSFPEDDVEKTFSIVTAPHERGLLFAMRMRPDSVFKKKLMAVPVGGSVHAEGPFGERFTLHTDTTRPAVFIAGGIGITPFLSTLSHVAHTKMPYRVALFYSNRHREDVAYLDRLHDLEKACTGLRVAPTLTRAENDPSWEGDYGHISPETIRAQCSFETRPRYYISGSPEMVMSMKRQLEDSGISGEDIVTKKFTGYEVS